MQKDVRIIICDLCERESKMIQVTGRFNDVEYDVPKSWVHKRNIDLCPRCVSLLDETVLEKLNVLT